MFATASTAGPVLGAVLTQYLSWRAIFVINLPLGLVAAWLARRIPAHPVDAHGPFRPDIAGVLLFGGGTLALLVALSSAGHRFGFGDWRLYALLAFAVASLALLLIHERRAGDPLIPVRLLATPLILRSNAVVLCYAAALFATVLYLPLYLQLGRGFGIGASGLLLLPLTLSIATTAGLVGRRIARTGALTRYPKRGLAVATAAFAGLGGSVSIAPDWLVLALTMLAGAGLGSIMPSVQIMVQEAGGQAALGRATASISLARAIGGALGVAVVGALVYALIGWRDHTVASVLPQLAESGGAFLATLPQAERLSIVSRLNEAFQVVFLIVAAMTAIGGVMALRIPRQRL